jgi:NADH-quinone oxidoreductase subunit A
MDYLIILLFMGMAGALVGGGLLMSRALAPYRPGGVKNTPYECGEKTVGRSWVHFNVSYYLFALLFLVFDVEAAFLYPVAVVFREVGVIALAEIGVFIGILLLALLYAWKKGVLEWD